MITALQYQLLPDVVLLFRFGVVLFIVGGLLIVVAGMMWSPTV